MSIIDCPHCGTRVGTTKDICPACRRDVTDIRKAPANLETARIDNAISALISAGKSRAVILRFLIEELAVLPAVAEQRLASVQASYRDAGVVRGTNDLVVGLFWFVGGAAVTVASLKTGWLQGKGMVIAFAAVLFGALRLVVGVLRCIHARRRIVANPGFALVQEQVVYAHLQRLEERARVGPAPPDVALWLQSHTLPKELLRLLTTSWPQASVDLVPFMLLSSTDLMKDDDVPRLLEHQLLKIGWGPNGDPLVVDLATESLVPGVVEHGRLWGREPEDADPRAYHRPIAPDLAAMFVRLATGQHVPRDYWAAVDFDPFVEQGGRH